jgi:ABC-type transporter Mla maintaining outer membrane lipid asymmetry ATPase subunit MlaF
MSGNAPVVELIDADIPRAQSPSAEPVVTDVDWSICRGEFWAVGAFAGTGKTDLLCTAAGLQRPIRGHHLLFGRDTSRMHEEELVANRLKVGMVFSSGRLFNQLTVYENIALPLRYHFENSPKEIAQRVERVLEQTGLADLKMKLPVEIPRNQHQRIALARSLALEPDVLMIDNPLLGVDARLARWWLDFLCALNTHSSMTLVIATDDLRPWTDNARQFAVLRKKQFETVGDREALRSSREEIVRDLLMPGWADE